ncbi:hypothetical protein C8R43DRAFT_954401 [Mycena crocata]|nr:hypothetical protein C8R43DRAFT_954401 [Mycena crocata]
MKAECEKREKRTSQRTAANDLEGKTSAQSRYSNGGNRTLLLRKHFFNLQPSKSVQAKKGLDTWASSFAPGDSNPVPPGLQSTSHYLEKEEKQEKSQTLLYLDGIHNRAVTQDLIGWMAERSKAPESGHSPYASSMSHHAPNRLSECTKIPMQMQIQTGTLGSHAGAFCPRHRRQTASLRTKFVQVQIFGTIFEWNWIWAWQDQNR